MIIEISKHLEVSCAWSFTCWSLVSEVTAYGQLCGCMQEALFA